MKIIYLFFFLLISVQLFSQADADTTLVKPTRNLRYEIINDSSIYYMIQRAWIANQGLSYASVMPYVAPLGKRRIALRSGEGESSSFSLIEARFDFRFPIMMGRKGQGFVRFVKLTFDYEGNFRMTLDDSKPLTPGNNKVGVGANTSLYNSYTGWIFSSATKNENSNYNSSHKQLKFWNALFQLHHYSNGQPAGFYYYPDPMDSTFFRNDYIGGDFSTNYFYSELAFGFYPKNKHNLHQFSAGYRIDLGSENSTFAYSEQQEKTYGRQRILLKYDYRSGPFPFKFFGGFRWKQNGNYYKARRMVEYHVRGEMEIITDDVSAFIPNLESSSSPYRMGFRGFFEITPLSHRSIGYFVSAYVGRDYLNIRYDDIIMSVQAGITFSFDKYYPPSWNSGASFYKIGKNCSDDKHGIKCEEWYDFEE